MAHQDDARGVAAVMCDMGTDPADGGGQVFLGRRPGMAGGQPIGDVDADAAGADGPQGDVVVEGAVAMVLVAGHEAAAVHEDQYRPRRGRHRVSIGRCRCEHVQPMAFVGAIGQVARDPDAFMGFGALQGFVQGGSGLGLDGGAQFLQRFPDVGGDGGGDVLGKGGHDVLRKVWCSERGRTDSVWVVHACLSARKTRVDPWGRSPWGRSLPERNRSSFRESIFSGAAHGAPCPPPPHGGRRRGRRRCRCRGRRREVASRHRSIRTALQHTIPERA